MQTYDTLMAGFPETSKQQWIAQAVKDLKGASFEVLEQTTPDGIRLEPFYTAEDLTAPRPPLFTHTDWEVCEAIEVQDAGAANSLALHALNNGATGLIFRISGAVDLEVLLREIGIEYIALQLEAETDGAVILDRLNTYLAGRHADRSALNISFCYDPIASLVQTGSWPAPEPALVADYRRMAAAAGGFRNLCVQGDGYHDAGATPAYELACILAHAHEYLTWLDEDVRKAVKIQVNIAAGPDYFAEIAKLRALRKVFALLLRQYGLQEDIYIHSISATRNLTIYDSYNNLLRTTTGAMAAVAGGCNSLQVLPYDAVVTQPDDFSRRMARNIQLILQEESYFNKVSDVGAGAYFIESLTEALAEKSWAYFQAIEAAGGLLASLQQGHIQEQIRAFAAAEQALFDEGKKVLVGTNKYPAPGETMHQKLTVPVVAARPAGAPVQPLTGVRLAAGLEAERLAGETAEAN